MLPRETNLAEVLSTAQDQIKSAKVNGCLNDIHSTKNAHYTYNGVRSCASQLISLLRNELNLSTVPSSATRKAPHFPTQIIAGII